MKRIISYVVCFMFATHMYAFVDEPTVKSHEVEKISFVFEIKRDLHCKKEAWKLVFGKCLDYVQMCKSLPYNKDALVQSLDELIRFLYRLITVQNSPIHGDLKINFVSSEPITHFKNFKLMSAKDIVDRKALRFFNLDNVDTDDVVSGSVTFEVEKGIDCDEAQWKKVFAIAFAFSRAWKKACLYDRKDLVFFAGEIIRAIQDVVGIEDSIESRIDIGFYRLTPTILGV